jgi:hypothetical protein
MNRDVHILVNCSGDNETAVFTVIRGQIRPPSAQGNPQGTARNDQWRLLEANAPKTGTRNDKYLTRVKKIVNNTSKWK